MDGNKTLTANFAEVGGSGCTCETAISMPFSYNGKGEYCWVAQGELEYVNSWNVDYLEVNGQDYTNTWTDTPPPSSDGKYHIHYLSTVSWAHFEIKGAGGNATPPDEEEPPPEQEDPPVEYELKTTVIGRGSITPSKGAYAEGTKVTLTATAAEGYLFNGWSGDVEGTAESTVITMDSDKAVTATFTANSVPSGCDSLPTGCDAQ
jgi:uncharacterized repeat protein (TIGR02543 family)